MFIFQLVRDSRNNFSYYLNSYGGPLKGQTIELKAPAVTIGRQEDNTIILNDPKVSRHHARIDTVKGQVYLTDLKSTAGSYVNGKRINRVLLKEGDRVEFYPSTEVPAPSPGFTEEKKEPPGHSHIVDKKIPVLLTSNKPGDLLSPDKTRWISSLKLSEVEEHARDKKKLEILLSVGTALSRPEHIEKKLEEILSFLLEIMDLDRAAIWLLEQEIGNYNTCVSEPLFKYKVFRKKHGLEGQEDPVLSMTIISKVLEESEGILVKDALIDEQFKDARSVKVQGIRTCVCVPLKTQKNLLGVLYADANRPVDKFTEEDLKFVSSFAAQSAVALENTLLYEKIQNEATIRSRFERFFPPNAIAEVIKKPEAVGTGGKEMLVTVVFSDIRNYTHLSTRRSPKEIANMLNEYFPPMVKIVFNRNGTLEKYIGDALMAIWGAPIPIASPEENAVLAAIDMQLAIADLNEKWKKSGPFNASIDIGIGVNTGMAFVGNIGDESYLQYAAIGDTTNLASRLCSSAAPGEIIVSDNTYNVLKNNNNLVFEEIESMELKGFAKKMRRFRLIF